MQAPRSPVRILVCCFLIAFCALPAFAQIQQFTNVLLKTTNDGTTFSTDTKLFCQKPYIQSLYNKPADTVEITTPFGGSLGVYPELYNNYYQLFRDDVPQSNRQQFKYFPGLSLPLNELTTAGVYNYLLRVEAENECGIVTTDTTFKVVAIDKPTRIKDIDIRHAINSQVQLRWKTNSLIATDYIIERRLEGTNTWSVINTIPYSAVDTMKYIDATVTALKTYSYRVAASNAKGRSGYSDIKTISVYDKVVYVNKTASGENNGLTWTDAFKDISKAMLHSEADLEIWVARGTYIPSETMFVRANGLYGGFAGGETNRDQRNRWENKTIIDGDRESFLVPQVLEIEKNSVFDGFTVTNGYSAITLYGLIRNCFIEENGWSLQMFEGSEMANCIVRNNYSGITRYGKAPIFNSIIYNNSFDIGTYFLDNGTWTPINDMFTYPDVYFTIIAHNPSHYLNVVRTPGRNNIANDIYNDPAIDGPRPEREGRVLTYLAGSDGVWGNDDDIFHWPDPNFIDKAVMVDPQVYANSKGFSKDLEGNARVFNGTADIGPIEYGPDLYALPPAPTIATTGTGRNVQVEVKWSFISDATVTKVWIVAKFPDGNDASIWAVDKQDQSKAIGEYPVNKGYSFELRYERSRIVSRLGPATQLTIAKRSGAVPFHDITTSLNGDAFLPSGTNDGRKISYTFGDPSIAEVVSPWLKPKKTGTTTITLTIPEDELYNSFTKTKTLTVTKGNQTLPTFIGGYIEASLDENTRTYPTSSNQGIALEYESDNTSVATVNGNVVTFLSSGSAKITAFNTGNENYFPVETSIELIVVISKSTQVLSDISNIAKVFGDADFTPEMTSNSGLTLSFTSSDPTIANVSDNVIHIEKVGQVTITVSQAGNEFWHPVTDDITLTIDKASEEIVFTTIHDQLVGTTIELDAHTVKQNTSTTFGLSSDKGSLSENTLMLLSPGKITITASGDATENYFAPSPVEQTICILPEAPVITQNGTTLISNSDNNEWFLNGTLINGENGEVISATDGIYNVRTIVETCVSGLSDPVVVKTEIVTGVNENEPSSIKLYPNPVSRTLYVDGLSIGDKIKVLDMLGKQMSARTASTTAVELNVSDFAQGVYYVVVANKNIVLKFVR